MKHAQASNGAPVTWSMAALVVSVSWNLPADAVLIGAMRLDGGKVDRILGTPHERLEIRPFQRDGVPRAGQRLDGLHRYVPLPSPTQLS
jgi:hypothetical protein